jgi:hypothetical protein
VRIDRFKEYLRETIAGSGHPGVTGVDTFPVPHDEITGIKVTCSDGITIYLQVVRTSAPGGDDPGAPETIVTKHTATTAG